MNIRLKQMRLRNFKGIKELTIDFNGQDTNIYGKNATGKTTIADSFSWLFFNKDSSGSADFDIKTKTADGEYLHNLEHSVECVVEVMDTMVEGGSLVSVEKSFKKIFKEKYTKQRGSTTATFTGHTTDYFVDDVPRKKKEYDETVNELFDSNIFPMITDPFYFNTRMKWQDRRRMLIDICGDVSDEVVIASNKDLEPLLSALNGKNVDDYRAQLKAQTKPINEELKALPIRINEAQLAIPNDIAEFDEEKYKFIEEAISKLESEKQLAMNGGVKAEKETELIKLRNQRLLLENELPDIRKLQDAKYNAEIQKTSLERKKERLGNDIEHVVREMDHNESKRNSLRQKFQTVKSMEYDVSKNICPSCGQELPLEKKEKAEADFNVWKSNEMEFINADGVDLKKQYDELIGKLDTLQAEFQEADKGIEAAQQKIADLDKQISNVKEDFEKSKAQRFEKIDNQIIALEAEIAANDNTEAIILINHRLLEVKEQKKVMDDIKASIKMAEVQKKRIQELEAREKQLADEYSLKDQMFYLTDLFIKTKVEMLTQKINSHFKLCSFKLFEEQINGGLNECCEVTVNGVNYSDLNNAMKINAGLDVINTICDYSNTYAPIFIDNAESVNKTVQTDSQQIRLYVTDADETLRVEQC